VRPRTLSKHKFLLFNMDKRGGWDMRLAIAALVLAVFSLGLWETSCQSSWLHGSENGVTIYDPNPTELWNRLHSVIFVRADIPSTTQVPDALDPPLWFHTAYLLAKPSHEDVLTILDEFLQTHGERLIHDPVKRAILQRDLWWVFDWSVEREPDRPGEPAYDKEKQELQSRLVEVMRRLALTPDEIHALPANYAQAVASGQFAKEYDQAHPDRPFLPPDLFDPNSSWVAIGENGANEPVAPGHVHAFSRSSFLVFVRLPGGRKATFDYLQTLWDFPRPWIPRPDDPRHEQTIENPELPQFPAGTQVALVRQMMLFDSQGNIEGTPITESVQIRVYRTVTALDRSNAETDSSPAEMIKSSGQDFYQIRLSRPRLFANRAGGLRATERDEKEFAMFSSFGADEGSPNQHIPLDKYQPVLQMCFWCHRGAGINSVNSRSRLLKPNYREHDAPAGASGTDRQWWEGDQDIGWKQNRYDWGLLSGYWKSAAASH
jgi:hypothetical protein